MVSKLSKFSAIGRLTTKQPNKQATPPYTTPSCVGLWLSLAAFMAVFMAACGVRFCVETV
jgi:hypothetical protein